MTTSERYGGGRALRVRRGAECGAHYGVGVCEGEAEEVGGHLGGSGVLRGCAEIPPTAGGAG